MAIKTQGIPDVVRLVSIPISVEVTYGKATGLVVALGPWDIGVQSNTSGKPRVCRRVDPDARGQPFMDDDGHLTAAGRDRASALLVELMSRRRVDSLRVVFAKITAKLNAKGLKAFTQDTENELADERRAVREAHAAGTVTDAELKARLKELFNKKREAHRVHGQFIIELRARVNATRELPLTMAEVQHLLAEYRWHGDRLHQPH